MRKHFITRMAGMVMVGLMAFSMSAPVMAEEAAAEETTDDAAEETTEAAASVETIALILPGVITDQSWSQLAYEALEDLKEEGYDTAYTESVTAADAETVFRTYADEGYDLIIGHGSEFTEAAVTVAGDYPDTYFFCTNKCPDGVSRRQTWDSAIQKSMKLLMHAELLLQCPQSQKL